MNSSKLLIEQCIIFGSTIVQAMILGGWAKDRRCFALFLVVENVSLC